MKSKSLKLPAIIIAIGLILTVAVYFITSIQKKPTVTEQDFPYSVTYKIDGETKTLEGVYTVRFTGFGGAGIDPLTRYYEGAYSSDSAAIDSRSYTILEKDGYKLELITLFNDYYLMGDARDESDSGLEPPCLEAEDADFNQYAEEDFPIDFNVEIVSWEYPEPIENSFVFAGFSALYSVNMCAMVLVGLLALVLCMIFVRKAEGVTYNVIDTIGTIFNFGAALVVLPIITFAAALIQAYPTGPDWIYQAYLCIPPIIPFSLAASVALRRKGYRWSGFLIQFAGVAVEVVVAVLEYIL